VIGRGTNQAKPRRKRAKYLDTRSGRIRLAAIPDNSAAAIEAFVRANVKPGTTLLTDGHRSYPGLTDYRHDPRTVGKMAGPVVLPWIHRVFSLMKRWGLGTYHGLRRKHMTPTSTSLSSDTIGASTGTSRSRPCSGSPRTITRQATGISSAAKILAKACRQSDASRDAEGQQRACSRMVQAPLKTPVPAPLRVRLKR
jgi:ISXO2-like transposase domain